MRKSIITDIRLTKSPLGLFGPGFKEMGKFGEEMVIGLNENAEEEGCKFYTRSMIFSHRIQLSDITTTQS